MGLNVHLPNQHTVYFREDQDHGACNILKVKPKLSEWFVANKTYLVAKTIPNSRDTFAEIGHQKCENAVEFHSRNVLEQMRKIQITANILKMYKSFNKTFLDMKMTK